VKKNGGMDIDYGEGGGGAGREGNDIITNTCLFW
jgi:hypothetical protein